MTGDAGPGERAHLPEKRSPWTFFLLVYLLSLPFWVTNLVFPLHLPVDNLPVTDIGATFTPLLAAVILVWHEGEPGGVRRFLARAFDYRRITKKTWYLPVIILMPALYVLTYGAMRLAGLPVPTTWDIPVFLPLVFGLFFIAAIGEEMGYSGYATDALQARYPALTAALIMGSIHAAWHWPSMIALGQPPGLFVMGSLLTVGFRVLTVWLYNNTGGSVFATILFHAVTNTGRSIFPGSRSAYEMGDGVIGYGLILIAAVVVVFLWGGKTLARFRYARVKPDRSGLHG